MSHRIVVSNYQRNRRAEVLVLKDPQTERELMFLHPDHNAVDAQAWAELSKRPDVAKMLADKVLVDKGDAPAETPPAAPETPAPETPETPLDAAPPAPEVKAEPEPQVLELDAEPPPKSER